MSSAAVYHEYPLAKRWVYGVEESMTTLSDSTLPVAYLATARLGEKGQITVPKEYREALAL